MLWAETGSLATLDNPDISWRLFGILCEQWLLEPDREERQHRKELGKGGEALA